MEFSRCPSCRASSIDENAVECEPETAAVETPRCDQTLSLRLPHSDSWIAGTFRLASNPPHQQAAQIRSIHENPTFRRKTSSTESVCHGRLLYEPICVVPQQETVADGLFCGSPYGRDVALLIAVAFLERRPRVTGSKSLILRFRERHIPSGECAYLTLEESRSGYVPTQIGPERRLV